jgi:hypothetical protein
MPLNVRLNKIELFEKITSEYSDLRKWLSQKRFTQWLESYAKYKSIKLIDGKSNNIRWIMFQDESTIISQEEEYVF